MPTVTFTSPSRWADQKVHPSEVKRRWSTELRNTTGKMSSHSATCTRRDFSLPLVFIPGTSRKQQITGRKTFTISSNPQALPSGNAVSTARGTEPLRLLSSRRFSSPNSAWPVTSKGSSRSIASGPGEPCSDASSRSAHCRCRFFSTPSHALPRCSRPSSSGMPSARSPSAALAHSLR